MLTINQYVEKIEVEIIKLKEEIERRKNLKEKIMSKLNTEIQIPDYVMEDNFDTNKIQSVELNLLNGQVEILLRSLELYGYNLEYMLNSTDTENEMKEEKLALLKYTYEQILSSQAEQVNGKSNNIDNISNIGKMFINDTNKPTERKLSVI